MQTLGIAFLAGCCAAVAIVWFMGSSPPTYEAIKQGCDREFPIEAQSTECQLRLGYRAAGEIQRSKLDRAYNGR